MGIVFLMNAIVVTARGVAYQAGIVVLVLSLYGCARERIYTHVESTPKAVISAEDAVQIQIQEVSERERAAQDANPCVDPFGDWRAPGSRVVGCGPGDGRRVLDR